MQHRDIKGCSDRVIDHLRAEMKEMIQRESKMTDEERIWVQEIIAKRKHLIDSSISGPDTPPLVKREQLKLWAKFTNHQYAAWSALFELITGYKPPKMKEVAAIISGH